MIKPTSKQLDYLELLVQGYTYKEIASTLGKSLDTVKTTMYLLRKRNSTDSSIQLVVVVLQQGWIDLNTLRRPDG